MQTHCLSTFGLERGQQIKLKKEICIDLWPSKGAVRSH